MLTQRHARHVCRPAHRRWTDCAQPRGGPGRRRHPRKVRRATHRRATRRHQEGRRPPALQRCDDQDRPRSAASRRSSTTCATAWTSAARSAFRSSCGPSFTLGGTGGGIAYNREELMELLARGLDLSPVHEVLARRVRARLEGIRARADARPGRQRHRHLLHRKLRSHGRAHRRLHHRRPGADAHRPRIPAHARRRHRRHPRDRRRDRRLEHSVRRESSERPHGGHRDEPARLALFGAGVESHRLPHRQDRRQARRRLHARRDHQRHHAQDSGLLRAHARLRRG